MNNPLRTANNMRSTTTIEHVFEERRKDGSILVRRADLPVGRGFGDGNPLYWVNHGWTPAEKYDADQHKKQIEAEQAAAAKAEKAEPKKVEKK